MQRFFAILSFACVVPAYAAEALPAFESFTGKSAESAELQRFITSRQEVEISTTIACPVGMNTDYIFRDLGVVLACDAEQVVSLVRFYGDGCPEFAKFPGDLPCGLSFSMTRREVEASIGRGKILSPRGAGRLWIDYPSRRLVIVYATSNRRDRTVKMQEVHLRAKP